MKKLILLVLAVSVAFVGFSYISNTWKRSQFESEIESLLQVAQGLNNQTAPGLFMNKAGQFGITLLPEDIHFEIRPLNGDTTTSKTLEKRGLSAQTFQATLAIEYSQPFLGSSRTYTLSRTRNFTRSASFPTSPPGKIPNPFDN